jgi:hypothetical protein
MKERTWWVLGVAGVVAACNSSIEVSECVTSTQCDFTTGGVCTPDRLGHRFCQYPEAPTLCPGGWRWSSEAGDGLAAVCVQPFAVTVEKGGDGHGLLTSMPEGIDCGTICTTEVADGHVITLRATPDATSRAATWGNASASCAGETCALTVTQAVTVSVTFEEVPLHTLAVARQGEGSGTVTSGQGEISCGSGPGCTHAFRDGTAIMLTATPDAQSSSEFAGWGGDATSCGTSATCPLTMDGDKSVTATFRLMPLVSVTVGGGGMGTVTSQPQGIACPGTCAARFPTSTSLALVARPTSGSGLAGWGGDVASCGFDPNCAVQVSGDENVSARFEKGGYVAWAIKVEATGAADVRNVRVDPDGDIVIAGVYQRDGDVAGTPLPQAGPTKTLYVAKLAGLDGSVRWARGFPTTGALYANADHFVVDPITGDIVLAGSFGGSLDLGGPESLQSDANGDLFVARLSGEDGHHLWSFVISSTADEPAIHVAIDRDKVLVMGSFTSSIDLGDGTLRPVKGFQDMYLAWHSLATGNFLASPPPKTIGDTGATIIVTDVAIDASHNFVATGTFSGTTKFGGGLFDPNRTAIGGAYVAKYDASGAYLWTVTGGSPGSNIGTSVSLGPGNTVYAVGESDVSQATDTVAFNGVQAPEAAGTKAEIFTASITSDGLVDWVRRFGGAGNDYAQRGAVDRNGNGIVVGAFDQSFSFDAFPVTANGSQADAFVSVLSSSENGSVVWADRYGGGNSDEAHGLTIDPATQHWIVSGGFANISKFGDKDLTATGLSAGFCVRIVPGVP